MTSSKGCATNRENGGQRSTEKYQFPRKAQKKFGASALAFSPGNAE
jgi:hypothetical protein